MQPFSPSGGILIFYREANVLCFWRVAIGFCPRAKSLREGTCSNLPVSLEFSAKFAKDTQSIANRLFANLAGNKLRFMQYMLPYFLGMKAGRLLKIKTCRHDPSGRGLGKIDFLIANAHVVGGIGKIAFITNADGQFPDVQPDPRLIAKGEVIEPLFIAAYFVQFRLAGNVQVADRACFQMQGPKLVAQQQGQVEILVPFTQHSIDQTIRYVVHGVVN